MTQITPHFTIEELSHSDTGIPNDCPISMAGNMARLADTLEQVRELLGVPLKINSGYRCDRVNQAVGGVRTSAHLFACAADFVPQGMPIETAFETIRKSGIVWDQLILEPTWIHIGLAPARETPRQECLEATYKAGGGMAYVHV